MSAQDNIYPPQHLYGIIGYPLGHSLSPLLHTWAMGRGGHAGAFYAWPVTPERLPDFIGAVRELPVHGLCVTIPHKTAVLPLLDGLSDEARAVGAANTLFWRGGALWGHNTDVAGFLAGLGGRGLPQSALVLGAGGAAHAVLYALKRAGVKNIRLAARNAKSGKELAVRFGVEFASWEQRAARPAQAAVNTTPLGMAGFAGEGETPLSPEDFVALGKGFAPGDRLAYDLVYNPLHTPFLRAAAACGWSIQGGLTMLAAQGLAQFELWSGKVAPDLIDAVNLLKSAL